MNELRLISLFGWFTMIAVAWAISYNRRLFPWRTVIWGVGLQLTLAVLILKAPWGDALFVYAGKIIQKLIQFSNEGCKFVFGPLADESLLTDKFGPGNAVIFAILVTGTIIIVACISSLLYHWGILQLVVRAIAWLMRLVMRTSGSETLSACANIFMGQTEAPLMIRPYIPRLTRSELMTIMVCGMAHIAGGVAAVYADMGRRAGYPNTAGHLLAASVLNCPAALMIAKILLPETQQSETAASMPATVPRTTANSIDAICRGASDGFHLALNVIAMLIGFIAMIKLVDYLIQYPEAHWLQMSQPASLETFFGWINAPFAWLMGVPAKDCLAIGQVLGERVVLNEFIGYLHLTASAKPLDPRSFTIATYALCGFANFSSIAIQVGGIGSLAPERRSEMAKLGFRAMLGGLLAAYMTASLAGFLL